mmetsp:Transcript_49166/g.104998  ORF Transcript_49166/g.104998 Transcript_49166/m.104998 type:complete len:265 (+) Transcript_49166:331-1125(+)
MLWLTPLSASSREPRCPSCESRTTSGRRGGRVASPSAVGPMVEQLEAAAVSASAAARVTSLLWRPRSSKAWQRGSASAKAIAPSEPMPLSPRSRASSAVSGSHSAAAAAPRSPMQWARSSRWVTAESMSHHSKSARAPAGPTPPLLSLTHATPLSPSARAAASTPTSPTPLEERSSTRRAGSRARPAAMAATPPSPSWQQCALSVWSAVSRGSVSASSCAPASCSGLPPRKSAESVDAARAGAQVKPAALASDATLGASALKRM